MAVKNFAQTFERCMGAHFSYFSTQMTNPVRKKHSQRTVTELRFLTQLHGFWFPFENSGGLLGQTLLNYVVLPWNLPEIGFKKTCFSYHLVSWSGGHVYFKDFTCT